MGLVARSLSGASTAPASDKAQSVTAWSDACYSRGGGFISDCCHLRRTVHSPAAQADCREDLAWSDDTKGIGTRGTIPAHAAVGKCIVISWPLNYVSSLEGKQDRKGLREAHYEVPSLEHQASSQRTVSELAGASVSTAGVLELVGGVVGITLEVAGGPASVSVNGAVTGAGTSSLVLGGVSPEGSNRAFGGSFSFELGPKAIIDKCVPS